MHTQRHVHTDRLHSAHIAGHRETHTWPKAIVKPRMNENSTSPNTSEISMRWSNIVCTSTDTMEPTAGARTMYFSSFSLRMGMERRGEERRGEERSVGVGVGVGVVWEGCVH
jgi:hypothetical protein